MLMSTELRRKVVAEMKLLFKLWKQAVNRSHCVQSHQSESNWKFSNIEVITRIYLMVESYWNWSCTTEFSFSGRNRIIQRLATVEGGRGGVYTFVSMVTRNRKQMYIGWVEVIERQMRHAAS